MSGMIKKLRGRKAARVHHVRVKPGYLSETKVKIFSGINYENVEKEISKWLKKEKPHVAKSNLAQCSFMENANGVPEITHKYTILLFYHERKSR